jgi:hypothetical protein
MSRCYRYLCTLLLAGAIAAPVLISGCAARAEYRVYDPYYSDYHVWNHDEIVYYQRWEAETHRDHRDFKKRSAEEQKEYWTWRHSHGDRH